MEAATGIGKLPVYKDVYRLSVMLIKEMDNVAVKYRRTLGERILTTALEVVSLLHSAYGAQTAPERINYLDRFQVKFGELQTLLRMANECRVFSLKRAASFSELVAGISKQIGGWKRFTENSVPEV